MPQWQAASSPKSAARFYLWQLARYVVVPAVEAVFGGNEAGGAVEGEAHLVHQSPLRQLAASATYFAVGAVAKFGAGKALGLLGNAARKGGAAALRVVNSKMGHAATRAAERAGFASASEARVAIQAFGKAIEANGLPAGTVADAAGHLVVPGFGDGGAVVYRQAGDKLTLQTVVNWIEGMGTPVK